MSMIVNNSDNVLNKFIDEFHLLDVPDVPPKQDYVRNYSLCLLKYYFIFIDIKESIIEGNGERLAILHKELVTHFKSASGFNSYAIEMLISIVQNELLLSPAELRQCIWASTANWKGGHWQKH